MNEIPEEAKKLLLTELISRLNKIHLAIGWAHFKGWFIEWKWQGEQFKSRLMFRFSPDEEFVAAKSFDEDLLPTYKFNKEKTQ